MDNQLHRIFISSEKNCRKIRIGLVSCSPELSGVGIKWKFWRNKVHHKQHRFKDFTYLCKNSQSLSIRSFHIPLDEAIHSLKSAKKEFLTVKSLHLQLQDQHIAENSERHKELMVQRSREKLKAKWRKHKKFFGKRRLNSISVAENFSRGVMIRATTQFDIEQAVMTDKISIFKLAYASPLLQDPLLSEFGISGELPEASNLVSTGNSPRLDNLSQLLSLFQKTNTIVILSSLTHD